MGSLRAYPPPSLPKPLRGWWFRAAVNLARARSVLREILVVAVLLIVGVAAYLILSAWGFIPISLAVAAQVLAALVLGYLAIEVGARGLRGMTSRTIGTHRGSEVAVAFRFVGCIALAFIVLRIVGAPFPGICSSRGLGPNVVIPCRRS